MAEKNYQDLLYKELSYQVQGAAIEVRKNFGPGHKESIYQNAFAEELKSRGMNFEREKNIKIYSPKTGETIGFYKPDFIIDGKIIVELKAVEKIPRLFIDQLYDYLRNSEYELGYFINFASPKLYIRRIIFTNDRKFHKLKNLLVVFCLILVSISVLPFRANGAELYFGAQANEVGVGTLTEVGVFLNTDGESVNAFEGLVQIPQEYLAFKEIRDGGTVASMWIEQPHLQEDGAVRFSGIIPGGYNGGRGYLFSVILEARAVGEAIIETSSEQVLRHDGQGTPTEVRRSPARLKIVPTSEALGFLPLWDGDPPEAFGIQIAQDQTLFDGQWFAVFSTQDKGSGIDRYEIHETTRAYDVHELDTKQIPWIKAESPYVLHDQKLRRYVYVRAIDKAGNARVAAISPRYPLSWYARPEVWSILGAVAGAALLYSIAARLWRKKQKKYTKNHE